MDPAQFEVRSETPRPGTRVLTVSGELDLNTAPQLEHGIEEALAVEPDAAIAIDLAGCEFIDSTGIALIVRTWQRLDGGTGGRLVLSRPSDQVRRLLSITGVEGSIPVREDLAEAIAELGD